jgi:integrase
MLTDIAVRNAKARAKPYKLADAGSLYLLVKRAGKYWRMDYRFASKRKTLALGVYPDVKLAGARKKRDKARELLDAGVDPSSNAKAEKLRKRAVAANSFEAVAIEWHQKQAHIWTAKHAADVKHRLETNLFPFIGRRPIAEIEAPELLAAVRKIEERGAFDLAHRMVQVAGQIFRYGIATGRCKRDIARDLRGALTPHKKRHQAAIKPEELPALMKAIDGYEGEPLTRLALQLMTLTFVRTHELVGAQWDEFDFDAGVWMVPAKRMKMKSDHVVPLAPQAVAILDELRTLAGHSRYVFPGRNPQKPLSNNTMLFALYRLGYKGKMTGHGFRTVASTALNEMGFRPDVVERQLAHCERNDVRDAYNRAEYLPERTQMMRAWADWIDAMRKGGKVLSLHRGKVA